MTLRLRIEPQQGTVYVHECESDSVVIGRSRQADLTLADRFVSRRHARLFFQQGEWRLEDLGAHNALTLNRIQLEGTRAVSPGDVIGLGSTRIVVEGEEGDQGAAEAEHDTTVYRPADLLVSMAEEPPEPGEGPPDRNAARLRVLNEVHRSLAAPIGLEALLELVLDRAFEHLEPDEGAVFLAEPGGELRRAAERRRRGASGELLFSRHLASEVTGKGLAALVTDVEDDARFASAESIVASGIRSLLAAPLQSPDGCLGMLLVGSRAEGRRFDEDDLALLACLASAAALRIRNLTLAEEVAERRALEKELALARGIQMAMLPRPLAPRPELEVAAILRPARSVGGDLYDFFLEGDRLWFLIGDVSGKGIGSALFMAVTKTLFRASIPTGPSLEDILVRVNLELCRDNERAMFVTAFVGCLDTRTGDVMFSNAGHGPAYLLRRDGGASPVRAAHGMALGAVGGARYETARLRLESGEAICLCTDGVTEAENAAAEQFGEARLLAYLGGAASLPTMELVDGLLRSVEGFAAGHPQSDDIAILSLRYLARS